MDKRVLIFCPYYPPHIGGLESHAKEFNEHLAARGFKIVVFTPDLPVANVDKKIENEIEVICFPAFELISNWPMPKFWQIKFWRLFASLFNRDFDVVISRTRFFVTSLMALYYSKYRKIKWIHIEHGSDFVRLSSPISTALARIYDELFGRLVFSQSDINIPISRAVDSFIEKFDKRKREVIYRGVNFEDIEKVEEDKDFGKKYKGHLKLVFCGRLYKWKGIQRSIDVVNKLSKKTNNKIVFVIIGDGEDLKRLSKNSNNNVKFVGYKDRDEALAIIKSSDIYLHSSYPGGGLSTSLLEAMSCGLCVIASPSEGADEVVVNNKNGFLIDYDDKSAVISLVQKLYNEPVYMKNMGVEAKKNIVDSFSWKRSIYKYEKVINSII